MPRRRRRPPLWILRVLDVLLLGPVLAAGPLLRLYRRIGARAMPRTTALLRGIGVYPIRDHYHEPLFNPRHLHGPLDAERDLPGIDLREADQLALVEHLAPLAEEFEGFLAEQGRAQGGFRLDNGKFEAGDAEFLHAFLRHTRPAQVIEIGCGASTQVIAAALARTEREGGLRARHICIEPYEHDWLGVFPGIELLRQPLELVDPTLFAGLGAGDLLFIDSSHVIRPQGDVLSAYLRILPRLAPGVNVHVHDIFTPRDYPAAWVEGDVVFWNEQYVLEALLSGSDAFRVLAALNFLHHRHPERLRRLCPQLTPSCEPGSFYLTRRAAG